MKTRPLGDLGVNGMGIPIGKLHLYVAGGGFHPTRTLPIQLDVGCDTPEVVDDPLYMGSRMPRLKGDAHESMVDELMAAVADKWPHCIVQFEDFRTEDALRYLTKYRHTYKHFNDDIQGTAAAVAAGFLNGMKAQRTALADARIIMYGAGSSAVGVALVLRQALERAGLSTEEARQRIYMVDSKGLITSSRGDRDTLSSWKQQFARTDGTPDMTQLADIVQHVRPHALFGLTGAGACTTAC
jgi:malic enzyme